MTKPTMNPRSVTDDGIESPYAARPWLAHYDYWTPQHVNYPRRPLYEILRMTAVAVPDQVATVFLGAELTYAQVREQSDKFATALSHLGVKQNDRVGIMLPNCPQYMIATFAILRLGAIVVNINPLYMPREVAVVAQDSGIRTLLVMDLLAPVIFAAQDQTSIENIIVTSLAEYSAAAIPCPEVENTLAFANLIAGVTDTELPVVEIDPDDVAVLQYTGGTTGVPKGAMLTHYNIFANTLQASLWSNQKMHGRDEAYLLVLPFFHIYGFTVGMMVGTWVGVRQILIPKYDVEVLLNAIKDYRPTYFPAVPTIYISLLSHPKAREYGIDKIRIFNSGSAPLPVEVIAQFERLSGGVTLCEGYGLSEASPVTHTTTALGRRKPGSIGLPLPDTDIKIVDMETGARLVGIGEEGELCIAGPQVMKGYWNRADETAIALRQDEAERTWLYTGDIARMDSDGYFYIVQRKKDMVIVGGFNVYPSEVESVLYTHPAVMEAAVIGIPDAYRGEVVKAFVVLKNGAEASPEDLLTYCTSQLAEFKVPRTIEIREILPKTAVGKILHRVLREEEQKKA